MAAMKSKPRLIDDICILWVIISRNVSFTPFLENDVKHHISPLAAKLNHTVQ